MSREDGPRGGQWLAQGGDVVADACDRRILRGAQAKAERDWCDADGARSLAERIEEWWLKHGRRVKCQCVPSGFAGIVAVRSDLGLSLPPRLL
jgi:hypothetical protein